MKKYLVVLFLLLILFLFNLQESFAVNLKQTAEITKIENELYGYDYSNDGAEGRIKRIEDTIFGKPSAGDLATRLKRINDIILTDQLDKKIKPTEDTYNEQEEIADSSVNYPILDEIEMKVFNKLNNDRDFHSRIVAIERKLFGKIYDVEDYSTRMDRIKAEVLPERLAREKVFGYDNTDDAINSLDLSGLNSNRFAKMPYGQENYTRPYANYGDYTGGAADVSKNIEDELAQMEYNTFGTEFSNEDSQTRIKRLNSVNKAKKSSYKYDNQKFNQRMSSFMEIGAMLLMILAMVL